MKYTVYIVADAEDDLFDIYRHIAWSDSLAKADRVVNNLQELCNSLEELPDRGHVPPELEFISVPDYREVHYKPYRVIYQIVGKDVYVHCVLDGRRDMQSLLQERLLR